MIKILFLLFISNSLLASTALVIQRSTQAGGEQKALIFESDRLLVTRNSSTYDTKNDYRLGQLSSKKSNDLYKAEERLKQISMALTAAEKMLEKQKTSFSKLNQNANPHGDKIYLDKILVTEDSTYYQELKNLITSLDTSKFTLLQGVQLSKDQKQLETVKDGVVASKEDFLIPFFCDKPKFPAKCMIRDMGFLYIK